MDGWMDGWMDGQIYRWMNRHIFLTLKKTLTPTNRNLVISPGRDRFLAILG